MDETRAANAMAYGMMAAEPGIDVMCLGEMGIANTTAASTLCAALYGGTGADWAGPGTGVSGKALAHKIALIDEALAALQGGDRAIRCRLLAAVGGEGIRGPHRRHGGGPHGPHPGAARRLRLYRGAPRCCARSTAARSTIAWSPTARPAGHTRLLAELGMRPLFDLDMRLGEASAAALAVPAAKAAAACHNGMATFAEAGVSSKDA